ncbi:MAG TPA: hypothetical protein VLX59_19555 [Acidimicrobiales bacterium]|nr:hypothetical protein [Acidimicrobiales bacterium]
MLRCRACGELVSEFAARCPQCHAGTEDAEELPPDPAPEPSTGPPTEPARAPPPPPATAALSDIQASPPPRRRRRPAQTAAGVVVILAVAALIAVSLAPSGSRHGANPTQTLAGLKLTGQVISDSNGTIVVSNPDGTRQLVITDLAPLGPGGAGTLTPSLDARFLATSRGDVISAEGLRVDRTSVASEFPTGFTAEPDPFAFDDRALVVMTSGAPSPASNEVSVVSLSNGTVAHLGRADDAAGDPQSFGAFVSIPDGPPVAGVQFPAGGGADAGVELVRAGAAPKVLATAGQLQTDLGQSQSEPVILTLFPSPAGDKVAVEVNPIYVGNSDAGLVVLNRNGRALATAPPSDGPVQNSAPAWAPDGESLAYYMFGPRGSELGVWHLKGSVSVRPAPDPGASFLACLWSPSGADILCPASEGGTEESSLWVLGAAKGGPFVQVPAPGVPEVWLPARGQG